MRFRSLAFGGAIALGLIALCPDTTAQCYYGGGGSNGGSNAGGGGPSTGSPGRGGSSAGRGGSVVSNPGTTRGGLSTGGPSTGGPPAGGPSVGAPLGGGPAVPATGPATPGTSPGRRGGMALDLRRHEHSQKLLAIEWDYASVLDPKQQTGPTSSEGRMQSLPREAALAKLTAKDGRPLLILRECEGCAGTEVALLDRRMNSERTQLLAQFFHCVKFKPNVLAEQHPYRQLFEVEHPAHVVLLSADGKTSIAYDGTQAQNELWKGMYSMLKSEYKRPAEAAANQLSNLMNEYDVLDLEAKALKEALERELERDGADSHRSGTLSAKVRRVEAKLRALEAEEAKLLDLGLKSKSEEATAKF